MEEELGLIVNQEKSRVAPIKKITFLRFQILGGKIRVSNQVRIRFKDRIRELTPRNNPLSMVQVLNKYLRGWVGYFGIQEFKYLFRDLDAWIRCRLRSMQLKKWKKPEKFQRIMILASSVGWGRGYVCGGEVQGSLLHVLCLRHLYIRIHRTMTRNSYSIPSCNVPHRDVGNAGSVRNMNRPDMRRHKRAIYPIA